MDKHSDEILVAQIYLKTKKGDKKTKLFVEGQSMYIHTSFKLNTVIIEQYQQTTIKYNLRHITDLHFGGVEG